VTATSASGIGPGGVYFLPAQFDSLGHFSGFGAAQFQATLDSPGRMAAFDDNGRTDLAVADGGGVLVIHGVPEPQAGGSSSSALVVPPNTTLATARDLGSVAHLVTLPEAIVAGYEDAYFTYHVPTEDVPGSGAELVDFSALFQDVEGAGLGMEVLDAAGDVLGSGDRFRVVAAQGAVLTIHVFGEPAAAQVGGPAQGSGVYTLDIDVLPQVVSVKALSPIPGGPVTSIVLTFQGDNLDLASAEDPANYKVSFLSGIGTAVPIAATSGAQSIIYDAGVNVDLTSGLTYPTAVDQTVTLLFAQPLAPGTYEVDLSPAIQAAAYSASELGALARGYGSFAGHPVVTVIDGVATNGASLGEPGLVPAPVAAAAPKSAVVASQFLTQLQADLAALLARGLRTGVGDAAITAAINNEILARYLPLYASQGPVSSQQTLPSFAIMWLDPVSFDLQSSQGVNLSYNLSTNAVSNGLGSTFVSVGGNVEMIVLENAAGTFNLDVSNVSAEARGGAVQLSAAGFSSSEFTAELQGGQTGFSVTLGGVTTGGEASTAGAPESAVSVVAGAASITGGAFASPTAGPGTGAAVAGTGFASTATVTLESAIAGPASTGGAASTSFSTGSTAATAAAAPSSGATAVTQPLPSKYGETQMGDSAQEQPVEGEPSGLPALQSVLLVVKRLLSRSRGMLGVLGRSSPGAVLRQIREMLEKLAIPAAANDRGAQNKDIKDANPGPAQTAPSALLGPAPVPAQDSSGIAIVHWDHGIEGLLQQRVPALAAEHRASGSGAFWAAAFLASGLVRSEINERAAAGSSSARKPRSEPRE
jgi:hypothetical protein